jgi:thiopeptide-type bacteriocin biosynthesis protein
VEEEAMEVSGQAGSEIARNWVAGHLYYHENLDRAIRGFVHPLVATLVRDGWIDGFFFVRFGLGGPHLRLRLRARPGLQSAVAEACASGARDFLARRPSTRPLVEEAIRRANEYILATDPHEVEDAVFADNTFRLAPFHPEVERYGGADHLASSLDLFVASSVAALRFLVEEEGAPRSEQLARAFRLLAGQALGFAADSRELVDLLRYGEDSWGGRMSKVLEKGDRVAQAQGETFRRLFQLSFADARAAGDVAAASTSHLPAAAAALGRALAALDRESRARVGGSQMHMTASRLGMSVAEEVYLSRLATATAAWLSPVEVRELARTLALGAADGAPADFASLALSAMPKPRDEPT